MDPEIQKSIAAGKLTAKSGASLNALKPGTYCFHKSWGFGQIESLNFLLNQITIDFKGRKGHTMQLQYAGESLQPIPADHILAQRATNLGAVKTLAKNDPVDLVRMILRSFGGKATQDQVAQSLIGDVFNEAEFKRWWDGAKKALKKDGHFAIPAKKTDPIIMREAAVSRAEELLAVFSKARQLKDQLAAVDQILKNADAFQEPAAQLQPVLSAIEAAAKRSQKLNTAQAFELVMARDELCEKVPVLKPGPDAVSLGQMLRDEDRRLEILLPDIPAAKQKRVLGEFPKAFGDEWVAKALGLMLRSSNRVVGEIARLAQEHGRHEDIRKALDRWIADHSVSADVLYWLCKERKGRFGDLVHPRILSAALSALERDQFSEIKRGTKLHDLLLDDRELIPDLLANADLGVVRDSMRKLLLTPVFEELNKRSIMGRIIRIHPEMQSLLSGESGEKQEALVVSWESLEKKKIAHEELINKRIPENTREIGAAREHGDLRENFEFKAAKQQQSVLMRLKAEMERDLSLARGTNFENPDTSQVSIGTVVTIKVLEDGRLETYTILGAWDGEPERHMISYLTAIGQALLAKKVGDQIELPSEHGDHLVEIVEISAYRAATPAEVA